MNTEPQNRALTTQELTDLPFVPQPDQNGVIDASALYPEARWQDAPRLEKDMESELIKSKTPFYLLDLFQRDSELNTTGQMWVLVIQIDQSMFTMAQGGEKFRDARFKAMQALFLHTGAKAIGPFLLTEIDTGKGNPYKALQPVQRTSKEKPQLVAR